MDNEPVMTVQATLKISFVRHEDQPIKVLAEFEDRLTRPTGERLLLMMEGVNKVKAALQNEEYSLVPNLDGFIIMAEK